jgi:hypothetical protein
MHGCAMKLTDDDEGELATRMSVVWDFIFKIEYDEALNVGFLERDAIALSVLGMPNFAAPHIWLDRPEPRADNFIFLGEDADGQSILYDKMDGRVCCILHDGRKVYVSPGILEFTKCLLTLAESIDRTIEIVGPGVYENGPFTADMISDLSKSIDDILGSWSAHNSFWATEINRMSSLSPKDGTRPE